MKFFLSVLLTLFLGNSIFAQNFSDTLKSAQLGNALSQVQVGVMYYNGKKTKQNFSEALKWFLKAAVNKSIDDKVAKDVFQNIAFMYRGGIGTVKSEQEALKWFRKAAEEGNPKSQYEIAMFEYKQKNYAESVSWLKKSASQGNLESQGALGIHYLDGLGIDENYEKAKQLFEKAAEQGDKLSMFYLAIMYHYGFGVEKNYEEAIQWYQKSSDKLGVFAPFAIGQIYHKGGYGVKADTQKALEWIQPITPKIKKNSKKEDPLFQTMLGIMFEEGIGVEQSYKKAVGLYTKGIRKGSNLAKAHLGKMYIYGTGVEKNIEKGTKLIKEAAEKGNYFAKGFLFDIEEQNSFTNMISDPEFHLQLIKIFFVITIIGFIALLIAGMTNKVVIYYDGSDFLVSFMTFGSWIVGGILIIFFGTEGKEEFNSLQSIIFYLSIASSILCAVLTVKSSIRHNENVVIAIIVGLFKIVSSALGILVIVSQISTFFDKKSTLKQMMWASLIFSLFIWIGKKLINGEKVYIAKGWALPEENLEEKVQQA